MVMDRGAVEMGYPADWSVEPDPQGYMRFEDPEENVILEASYLPLPQVPDLPTPAEQLREVLCKRQEFRTPDTHFVHHEDPATLEIHQSWRQDMEIAWTDYTFDVPDRSRDGLVRLCHGRWLMASNGIVQTLWTYYYWDDHAATAIDWWERMSASLQLGRGKPMKDPYDHWSMREPD